MKITKRSVNTKRHTTGYLVGGRWMTRAQAVRLASKGKIDGVRVCSFRGSNDEKYIAALPGYATLYDLPVRVQSH